MRRCGMTSRRWGVEIERHNVRLLLSEAHRRADKWLVRSPDGLVRVVWDAAPVWASAEGVLYESPEAMATAGAVPGGENGGKAYVPVPELVTAPVEGTG